MCSALVLGLYSCSSDDKEDAIELPSKKLSKVESYGDDGTLWDEETFSYDAQGRWIKSVTESKTWTSDGSDPNYKPDPVVQTLSYSGDKITYSFLGYDKYTEEFTLKNNRLYSRDDEYIYHYENGYLMRISDDYANFSYSDGNLVKIIEEDGESEYTITYTDDIDKLGINIFEASYNDGDVDIRYNNPLYQFGYFGKKSKNLISTIKSRYNNGKTDTMYCSYKFDSEGYVTEMIVRGGNWNYKKYKFYYN